MCAAHPACQFHTSLTANLKASDGNIHWQSVRGTCSDIQCGKYTLTFREGNIPFIAHPRARIRLEREARAVEYGVLGQVVLRALPARAVEVAWAHLRERESERVRERECVCERESVCIAFEGRLFAWAHLPVLAGGAARDRGAEEAG